MSSLYDRELADTMQAERYRRRLRERTGLTSTEVVLDADRGCPRWQRIRAALCDITTLRMPLDEYADRIWLVLTKNTTDPDRTPSKETRGRGQEVEA